MKVKVTPLCLTLCNPMDYTVPEILQARILEWAAFPSGIEPRSPTLQAASLPAEPQGKPKNTAVGSLSLLHGIFPNQESNQGLLISLGYMPRNGIAGSYGGKISPPTWATRETRAIINYHSLISSQFSYLGMTPYHSYLMLPSKLFLFRKEKNISLCLCSVHFSPFLLPKVKDSNLPFHIVLYLLSVLPDTIS